MFICILFATFAAIGRIWSEQKESHLENTLHRCRCHRRNSTVTVDYRNGYSGDTQRTHGCFAKMREGN